MRARLCCGTTSEMSGGGRSAERDGRDRAGRQVRAGAGPGAPRGHGRIELAGVFPLLGMCPAAGAAVRDSFQLL